VCKRELVMTHSSITPAVLAFVMNRCLRKKDEILTTLTTLGHEQSAG